MLKIDQQLLANIVNNERRRSEMHAILRGKLLGKIVRVNRGKYKGRDCKVEYVYLGNGVISVCAPPLRLNPKDGSTLWNRSDARNIWPIEFYDDLPGEGTDV